MLRSRPASPTSTVTLKWTTFVILDTISSYRNTVTQPSFANMTSARTALPYAYPSCPRTQQTLTLVGLSCVFQNLLAPSITPLALRIGHHTAQDSSLTSVHRHFPPSQVDLKQLSRPNHCHKNVPLIGESVEHQNSFLSNPEANFCDGALLSCPAYASTTALLHCDDPYDKKRRPHFRTPSPKRAFTKLNTQSVRPYVQNDVLVKIMVAQQTPLT